MSAPFPLAEDINLSSLTDEDLVRLLDSAPVLYHTGETKIVRLSKNLVLKAGGNVLPCEAKALELVAAQAPGIRAPRVHRSFFVADSTKVFGTMGYIVMDYIDGQPLDHCWDDLPRDTQVDISKQVADMILEMQSIVIARPGPISGGPCRGFFFAEGCAGPLETKEALEDWFNGNLEICKRALKASQGVPPFEFTYFVLVHQDISPRNLILDQRGQVWLVDWVEAGAYPPSFESANFTWQVSFPDFNQLVLSLIPNYPSEVSQLESILYVLMKAAPTLYGA